MPKLQRTLEVDLGDLREQSWGVRVRLFLRGVKGKLFRGGFRNQTRSPQNTTENSLSTCKALDSSMVDRHAGCLEHIRHLRVAGKVSPCPQLKWAGQADPHSVDQIQLDALLKHEYFHPATGIFPSCHLLRVSGDRDENRMSSCTCSKHEA